tara:strand:+ start:149 stop:862 length:714 start_codon:yes stop_codon:yes gene_type:complete
MSKKLSTQANPTRLLVEKNTKDELVKGRIEDATLLYVSMQEGELAFGSETDRQLSVQVAVTEDTAKNWKATFPKNGYREVPNDQFEKAYKTDPPYPAEEKQHVLKLKSRATYQQDDPERDIRAGDIVPYESPSRPKLYEVVDGKPVDITQTTQPANGSRGVVAFRATNNKFGTFPVLSGVLVTELIEAERQANLASDFGITEETPSTNRLTSDTPDDNDNDASQQNGGDQDLGEDWF